MAVLWGDVFVAGTYMPLEFPVHFCSPLNAPFALPKLVKQNGLPGSSQIRRRDRTRLTDLRRLRPVVDGSLGYGYGDVSQESRNSIANRPSNLR